MEQCDECGFAYDLGLADAAGHSLCLDLTELTVILARGDTELRSRREPNTWSPLEYGCHLRDVLLVQRERVLAARRTDRPSFEPMGRAERVDHDGYAEQDPVVVARQLEDAGRLFANVLSRLTPADWNRSVVYSYPRRAVRSLQWVAVHTLHEVRHHTLDVRRQV